MTLYIGQNLQNFISQRIIYAKLFKETLFRQLEDPRIMQTLTRESKCSTNIRNNVTEGSEKRYWPKYSIPPLSAGDTFQDPQ